MKFPIHQISSAGVHGFCLAAVLNMALPAQQPAVQSAHPDASAAKTLTLDPGKTIARELRGGETHEYQFALQAGQYAHVEVDQKSIDVTVVARGPDGERIFEDNVTAAGELESASLIGSKTGPYRISVQAAEKTAVPGEYEIKLADLQQATEIHKNRIAAERAIAAGNDLYHQQSADALKGAIPKYQEALEYWRAAHDVKEESAALSFIGVLYRDLGDRPKALEFINQGLQVARASGDRVGEAWALDDIGSVHEHFGDMNEAIKFFDQALPLWQTTRHRAGEQSTLNGLGMAYFSVGKAEKARDYFEQAVVICHELRNPGDEGVLLLNLGESYGSLGDYHKALEMENQALALSRQAKNRVAEAQALTNMGFSYSNLSEYQKAMDSFMASVNIAHELG